MMEIPVFTRRPAPGPVDQLPPDCVEPADLKDGIALLCHLHRFTESKDPIAAIEAFLLARQEGVYPPGSVLDYVADVFQKWYESNGTESLDKLFGLRRGKGQQPAFTELLRRDRDYMLMLDMWRLPKLFGVSFEQAAVMIAERMKNEKWDQTGINLGNLSADTILTRYKREKWGEIFGQLPPLGWTEDEKRSFLALFPKHTLPAGLKSSISAP